MVEARPDAAASPYPACTDAALISTIAISRGTPGPPVVLPSTPFWSRLVAKADRVDIAVAAIAGNHTDVPRAVFHGPLRRIDQMDAHPGRLRVDAHAELVVVHDEEVLDTPARGARGGLWTRYGSRGTRRRAPRCRPSWPSPTGTSSSWAGAATVLDGRSYHCSQGIGDVVWSCRPWARRAPPGRDGFGHAPPQWCGESESSATTLAGVRPASPVVGVERHPEVGQVLLLGLGRLALVCR